MKPSPEILAKLARLAAVVEAGALEDLIARGSDCAYNRARCKTSVALGSKYARVDIGGSGRYMVNLTTLEIVGIKAYGVPHLGYRFGTLDTIDDFDWAGYRAHPRKSATAPVAAPVPPPAPAPVAPADDPFDPFKLAAYYAPKGPLAMPKNDKEGLMNQVRMIQSALAHGEVVEVALQLAALLDDLNSSGVAFKWNAHPLSPYGPAGVADAVAAYQSLRN